jgi:hypothetical protein
MAEKTAVYSLGRKGVNLVDDPLILDDGAFTLGQNAQVSPEEAEGSVLKRAGMGMLLIPPSASPVLAILSLPFADSSPGVAHATYPPWLVPGVPENGAIDSVTHNSVTVSFDLVLGATNYIVRVYENGVEVANAEDTAGPITVTGLDPETQYTVGVTAENEKGEGEESDPDDLPAETDEDPGIPSTGTFQIPLDSVTGFAASLFQNGPTGAEASITGAAEVTEATFSATEIALNGGAPILVSSLPAGFNVTLARFYWGLWVDPDDLGTLPGPCGRITIMEGVTMRTQFLTSGNYLVPTDEVYTYSPVPDLADILGLVLENTQDRIYGDPYYFKARASVYTPSVILYGNYEIV